jgi:uncharacterized repeat protein (TIGR01451 family)
MKEPNGGTWSRRRTRIGLASILGLALALWLAVLRVVAQGPYLVRDINSGPASADPAALEVVGRVLYFAADDGTNGNELWRSSGSQASTSLVKDIHPNGSAYPYELTAVGGRLFFRATDPDAGRELWTSDGSAAGTRRVKDISPGAASAYPADLTEVKTGTKSLLFFHATDGSLDRGRELWVSDGTETGTALVRDIRPGSGSSNPGNLVARDGILFFSADDGTHGDELWRSDGTVAGTVMVKDIRSGPASAYLEDLVVTASGRLFFSANDGTHGRELWTSDGTAEGTVLVKDIAANGSSANPVELAAVGDVLYFSANDGNTGQELWKSDGTAAGTVLVKDIAPGGTGSNPSFPTSVQGTLYFVADDGVVGHGFELWKSDGTAAGTLLLRDILAGSASSYPDDLVAVGDWLFFSADDGDGAHGRELWRSDGSRAGTILAGDINPGPGSSNPQSLVAQEGLLYFNADDGNQGHGAELWALRAFAPDLVLNKQAAPSVPVAPSGHVTYTLGFGNEGNYVAPGVVVSDTLPAELTQVQVTSDRTLTPVGGANRAWQVGPLAPGETAWIIIAGLVQPGQTKGYTFDNKARIGTAAVESDMTNNESTADVTINFRPVGQTDQYSTPEDQALVVDAPGVLANDGDVDGDPLTATLETPPAQGTLNLRADGSFTYTPPPNYHGTVSFAYRAHDGQFASEPSVVSLVIDSVNDVPVAQNDSYRTTEDVPRSVPAPGVLGNDRDDDGQPLTAVLDTPPAQGTLDLKPDGSFTYTPAPDAEGRFTFTYYATDGQANSNQATVTLEVSGQNDAPAASSDKYDTPEDQILRVGPPGVLLNDDDPDGDALKALLASPPPEGTLALAPDGGFVYTPTQNYHGLVSFTYRASDDLADSNLATVTLQVKSVNDAPLAFDDQFKTLDDVPMQVPAPGVLSNDADADGDSLTAVLDSEPEKGELILESDGSLVYTPQPNAVGTFTFQYHVHDGQADSRPGTVTLIVSKKNDPPLAIGDSYTTAEEQALVVPPPGVLQNDEDPDSDPLIARLQEPPPNGAFLFHQDGSFVYTPTKDFDGQIMFSYWASDGLEGSAPVAVNLNITPVNDPPTAVEDSYQITDQSEFVMPRPGVLGNDYDVERDELTAVLDTPPQAGTLNLNPDGSFSYRPEPGRYGNIAFTYRAHDGEADSWPTRVTISVVEARPVYLPLILR